MPHDAILTATLVGCCSYAGVRILLDYHLAGRLEPVPAACWIAGALLLLGVLAHG